jgi:hypothetical protein
MGLLDNLFMTQTPDYLTSLLGDTGVQDLQKKALTSGIVNTLIGYAAAPKNQRLGLGRILANSYQQGITGAQGTVDKATQDYINAQKIGELKQKAEADKAWADIQDKIYTKTPDVTKQVTTAGGYAPSMDQVAPEQVTPIPSLLTSAPTQPVPTEQPSLLSAQPTDVSAPMDANAPAVSTAPNFGMVKQPDVTTTQVVQTGKPTLNSDLIQQFVTKYPSDERAQKLLANMEMIKKLGAPEKGFKLLTDEQKKSYGLPLDSQYQVTADGKLELVSGTEQKVPDIVQLQNQRDKLVTNNTGGQNDKRISEIQAEIDHKIGKDQDPAIQLTDDAKRTLARTFLDTGNIAIMGMGKNASGARNEIYNMAASMGKAEGLTTDQISAKINENKQNFAASSKALKEFTSGADAKTIRSLNVVVSHLDTLNELAQGLDSNDTRIINRVRNAYRVEFGKPAPTSFNAAKEIVGDEIIKSIVARGGTLEDRTAMKKTLDAASSPDQLAGVVTAYQKLLGGQLAGFEKSYVAGTNRTDFKDRFLNPRTIKTLPAPDTGMNQQSQITEGSTALSKSGKPIVMRNGKWEYK